MPGEGRLRLAVLSDIHDQTENLRAILTALKFWQAEALVLCGDITQPRTLSLCQVPGARLHYCLGNCDQARAQDLLEAGPALGAQGHAGLGRLALPQGRGLAFCHFPAQAAQAAHSGQFSAVFYGHSHRPALTRLALPQGEVVLANPGDVQGRYGRVSALVYDSADGSHAWVDA